MKRLNQIRRENPALQRFPNVALLETESEHLFAFAKRRDDNAVVVVVNVDPHNEHEGVAILPASLGFPPAFAAQELLSRPDVHVAHRSQLRAARASHRSVPRAEDRMSESRATGSRATRTGSSTRSSTRSTRGRSSTATTTAPATCAASSTSSTTCSGSASTASGCCRSTRRRCGTAATTSPTSGTCTPTTARSRTSTRWSRARTSEACA